MKKEQEKYHRCAFDVCDKRLIDFAFVSQETGEMFCDEICCERDLEQSRKRQVFLWQ